MDVEADQKHVPQLLEDLGLIHGNVVKNPSKRQRFGAAPCDARTWRRTVWTPEAVRCLARAMSKPKAGHMTQLKRAARYLKGVPRTAQQHAAPEPSRAHLDSDWAGDTVTRRSTSGVIVRRLAQTQLNSTKRHSVAESDCGRLRPISTSVLGLQSLFADSNLKLQLSMHTDSSSAKVVASRRGAGKSTRHIQTRMLWLQEQHSRVVKVATESNPADMLTQALGRSKVEEFCADWSDRTSCEDGGQETQGSQEAQESQVLQLKRWRCCRMMQRSRTSRRMKKLRWMHAVD